MKIELHKAFRVPIDGLTPIAEEIVIQKQQKEKEKRVGPYVSAAPAETAVESESDDDGKAAADPNSKDEKKRLKKEQKAQQRDKRRLKKELKLAFGSAKQKNMKMDTVEQGSVKPGTSVKVIN